MSNRHWQVKALAMLLAACSVSAIDTRAQGYPEKPIRMIVPFAPGGNADILARLLGQRLTETLGRQIVIENRAGANGVIGTDVAAKSAPDGYTIVFIANGHATNPALYPKLPFDPIKDFAPVTLVGSTPLLLTITNALPAKSVKELITLARSRPGAMSFATQGNGSAGHLAGVLLNSLTKVDIVHVPYKATAQALIDLASGQVQVMYPSMTSVLPHIKAGKLRALAITTRKRSALAPELPTVIESGIPNYEADIWNGVLAPAGTPQAIVSRLNAVLVQIIRNPENAERIKGMGADPAASTPEEFAAYIAAEIAKWGKIIKAAGVRLD